MTIDLEHAVTRALQRSGTDLPHPIDDLAADAMRRHRRRRTVRAYVAAGAVVLTFATVTAGVAVFGHAGTRTPATWNRPTPIPSLTAPTTAATPRSVVIDPAHTMPVTTRWPQAVRRLPALLPNGHRYNVIGEIDGGYVVQEQNIGYEKWGSLYRFAPGSGTLVELLAAPTSSPQSQFLVAALVNHGADVAVVTGWNHDTARDIYVVSTTDGHQVAHARPTGSDPTPDAYAWVDGEILWSSGGKPGIYSAGQPTTPIAKYAGYAITGSDAWAVSESPTQIAWWNLATGERHQVPVESGYGDGRCRGTYCALPDIDSFTVKTFSGTTTTVEAGDSFGYTPVGDHFMDVQYADDHNVNGTVVLCDLATAVCAGLPIVSQTQLAGSGTDIVNLPDAGGRKVILNLAAIAK